MLSPNLVHERRNSHGGLLIGKRLLSREFAHIRIYILIKPLCRCKDILVCTFELAPGYVLDRRIYSYIMRSANLGLANQALKSRWAVMLP